MRNVPAQGEQRAAATAAAQHGVRIGFTVRRYTEAQIRNYPAVVVADLRDVLGAPAAPAQLPSS